MSDLGPPSSLSAYGRLIDALIARGYRIVAADRIEPASRHLVLRHDVDFDLAAAVAMAEMEAGQGHRTHYFVLVRTEFYNPFSRSGTDAIRRLHELGHDVGLHFDAAYWGSADTDLTGPIARECDLLADILGAPVTAFSFHRPRPGLLDREISVPGRLNMYAVRFFRDIGYCSDSRGAWNHGHPLDHPAVAAGRALQLLTHPIWWTSDAGATAQDKLERFLDRRRRLLDREAAANCDVYRPVTPRQVPPGPRTAK